MLQTPSLISWTSPDQRASLYLDHARGLVAKSRSRAAKVLRHARARRNAIFAEAAEQGRESGVAELRAAVMAHLETITQGLRSELESCREALREDAANAMTQAAMEILGAVPELLHNFARRCQSAVPSVNEIIETRIDPTSHEVQIDLPSGTLRFSLREEFFAALRDRLLR